MKNIFNIFKDFERLFFNDNNLGFFNYHIDIDLEDLIHDLLLNNMESFFLYDLRIYPNYKINNSI